MKVNIIITCLVILAFAATFYKLFKLTPSCKHNKIDMLDMMLLLLILAFMLSTTATLTLTYHSINEILNRNPEIEMSNSIDDTTAPDDSSVPETKETIHIDISSPEPSTPSKTPETTPVVDPDELEMLACVIYQEAGGNACCDDCRRRVADVVLNRVADKRFPNTIEAVLTAKNQYGRFYYTGIVWPKRATNPNEKKAVERAYRIAEEVLKGQHSELYGKGYIWQATFKQSKDNIYCCGHYYGR